MNKAKYYCMEVQVNPAYEHLRVMGGRRGKPAERQTCVDSITEMLRDRIATTYARTFWAHKPWSGLNPRESDEAWGGTDHHRSVESTMSSFVEAMVRHSKDRLPLWYVEVDAPSVLGYEMTRDPRALSKGF